MSERGQTGVHQGRDVNDMMAEYTDRLQKENAELRARVARLEEREAVLQSIILFLQDRTATFDFTHPNIISKEK